MNRAAKIIFSIMLAFILGVGCFVGGIKVTQHKEAQIQETVSEDAQDFGYRDGYDTASEEKAAEIADLEAEIEDLNNSLADLQNRLKTVKTEEEYNELVAQIAELNAQIVDLQSQLEDKQSELSTKENEVSNLSNQISTLQSEKTTLQNTCATLEAQCNELLESGEADQQEIDSLNSQISALEAQIQELEDQIETLQNQLFLNPEATYLSDVVFSNDGILGQILKVSDDYALLKADKTYRLKFADSTLNDVVFEGYAYGGDLDLNFTNYFICENGDVLFGTVGVAAHTGFYVYTPNTNTVEMISASYISSGAMIAFRTLNNDGSIVMVSYGDNHYLYNINNHNITRYYFRMQQSLTTNDGSIFYGWLGKENSNYVLIYFDTQDETLKTSLWNGYVYHKTASMWTTALSNGDAIIESDYGEIYYLDAETKEISYISTTEEWSTFVINECSNGVVLFGNHNVYAFDISSKSISQVYTGSESSLSSFVEDENGVTIYLNEAPALYYSFATGEVTQI